MQGRANRLCFGIFAHRSAREDNFGAFGARRTNQPPGRTTLEPLEPVMAAPSYMEGRRGRQKKRSACAAARCVYVCARALSLYLSLSMSLSIPLSLSLFTMVHTAVRALRPSSLVKPRHPLLNVLRAEWPNVCGTWRARSLSRPSQSSPPAPSADSQCISQFAALLIAAGATTSSAECGARRMARYHARTHCFVNLKGKAQGQECM